VAIDDEGPQAAAMEAALARGIRAAVLTVRGQNPTGGAITAARAATLGALLRKRDDLLLIESDPLGPVAGVPLLSVAATATGIQRWAHVRSVAKFLGPDLRLAVMTGDPLTLGRFVARQALSVRWVSRLLQRVAIALWSDPAMGRRLARAADIYAMRRTALVEELSTRGVAVSSRSGFNVWVPVREESAVVEALAQRGWQVAAGERFRIRSSPGIRITTACLSPDAVRQLSTDLVAALQSSHRVPV
jgi:DNA-binding transcriptional MocR family regulator